jgi:uncharacterized membrane protein
MRDFISGAIMLGTGSIALFFVRFWIRTRERLLLFFGLAFVLLSLERWVLAAVATGGEVRPFVYLIRLTAFVLIITAIVIENRGSRSRGR